MKVTYYYAEKNHESHNEPSFDIEKSKRTVLVFFFGNSVGMFSVKSVKDDSEEKQEYQSCFTDFE